MKTITNNKKIIEIMLITCGLFLIPTFLEQIINLGQYKQFIIGTIVNTSLIISSIIYKTDNKKLLLLSTLPSISTICSGLLFAGLSYYSKLMIPFIWIGNITFVYLYRYLYINKKHSYFKSGIVSLISKVIIIFSGFSLLNNILNFPNIVKETLSLSMGLYQFITGIISITIIYILRLTQKEK